MNPWEFNGEVWVNKDTGETMTVEEWDMARCRAYASLKAENEALLGGLADIAYSDDMTLDVAQKKAARLYTVYKMGLVVVHADMYDSGEEHE